MMRWFRSAAVLIGVGSLLFTAGCADFTNTRNMAAVGTLLGTGAGIAIGAATGDMAQGAMLGAGIGGLAGAAGGQWYEGYQRKRTGKKLLEEVEEDMLGGKEKIEGIGPGHYDMVKKSKWVDTSSKKRVWVEEKVVDGKVAEAHFEERLIPSGYWVEEEEKVWVEDNPSQSAGKSPETGSR
jgi:hypothetical protein